MTATPFELLSVATRDHLGEGPWWDAARAELLWVDILGRRVRRATLDGAESPALETPTEVGFAVRDTDGRVLAGLSDGLAVCSPSGGGWTPLWTGDHDATAVRINDGKTDHDGRVWFGTMHRAEAEQAGALYSYGAGAATLRVPGITTSNGLGWSPDGRLFYYTDSMARAIWVYDVGDDGGISNRRVFASDPGDYVPDGLTVDASGAVWAAKWNGGRVVRYTPDGTVDRVLELPVRKPTSAAFAGAALDTLVITSANMDDGDGDLAGSVFLLDVGATGIADRPADVRLL
jgi:sugar lactone lactonase YvrE